MDEPIPLTAGLEATLAEASRVGAGLRDAWWVIGSAAIALSGVAIEVPDVDLLVSQRDAETLLRGWATPKSSAEGGDRFRSLLGEHRGAPIPIEIMGALEVSVEGLWMPVTPTTRHRVAVGDGSVFIPDVPDQLALLLMFRRPQDLVRAEMLMRAPG